MVNANDYGPSHSNNIDKNNGKAGNGIDIHSGRSKVQNVQMKKNTNLKFSRIHSNYSLGASKQILTPVNTSANANTNANTNNCREATKVE